MEKECKQHKWIPLLGRLGKKNIPTSVFACFFCGEMKVGTNTIKMSQFRMDMGELPMRNVGTLGIVSAPASDLTVTGMITELTAGATLVFGDVCYIASTGKTLLADADAIATSSGVVLCLESLTDTNAGDFLLHGVARNDAWAWTPGGLIYLSTTAGAMTQSAPSATDDVIQILGVATHADRIYFNPSLIQVEHT